MSQILNGQVEVLLPSRSGSAQGAMVEFLNDAEVVSGRVKNLHAITIEPGAVRGNHVHPHRTESMCVVGGNIRAHFKAPTGETDTYEVDPDSSVIFRIKPGVAHALENIGTSLSSVICWADIPFSEDDIERVKVAEADS
jgi:dTDP-4-dehydrorhamnose 3,5-epimerase-like enzyme